MWTPWTWILVIGLHGVSICWGILLTPASGLHVVCLLRADVRKDCSSWYFSEVWDSMGSHQKLYSKGIKVGPRNAGLVLKMRSHGNSKAYRTVRWVNSYKITSLRYPPLLIDSRSGVWCGLKLVIPRQRVVWEDGWGLVSGEGSWRMGFADAYVSFCSRRLHPDLPPWDKQQLYPPTSIAWAICSPFWRTMPSWNHNQNKPLLH